MTACPRQLAAVVLSARARARPWLAGESVWNGRNGLPALVVAGEYCRSTVTFGVESAPGSKVIGNGGTGPRPTECGCVKERGRDFRRLDRLIRLVGMPADLAQREPCGGYSNETPCSE